MEQTPQETFAALAALEEEEIKSDKFPSLDI